MNYKNCLPQALLILIFPLPYLLQAQFAPTIADSIYSNEMKELRKLRILLPADYKKDSTAKYDAVYLLDGEWNSGLVSEVQSWLKQWGFTPPVILVGIENTYINGDNQRFRDLTPTKPTNSGTAGGGPAFLAFIKNELVPYINKTYPSDGSNILFGHSLGGLFVLYTLFTEPQLFNSYVAADPSLWWDNGYLLTLASHKLSGLKDVKSLFITGRPGGPYHEMKIDSLDILLRAKAPPTLQWKTVTYPDETHVSQQYKSAYDGLKYSLAPALKKGRIDFDPREGIVLKNKPFGFLCYNFLSEKYIHYTLNGTEPQLTSALLKPENSITLQNSASIKIKSFYSNPQDDKTISVHFIVGDYLPTVKKPAAIKPTSLNFTCYADSSRKQKIKSGILTHETDINKLVEADSYYGVISGYLQTLVEGYYTFEITGEKGNKLYLGDKLLIEMNPVAGGPGYQSFIVPLKKGFYPIRFEYSHKKDGANLDFSYIIPGASGDGSIPEGLMYYVP